MPDLIDISGMKQLWAQTQGDREICVAVLDGLVDLEHPCFDKADLLEVATLVQGKANSEGKMSTHGTHVTSTIFAQPDCEVRGIAPECRGAIVPVFSDDGRQLSQLELARAIELALDAGAHIINISGGQLTDFGEAEPFLERAVALCEKHNVLIVAAAGNDSCECLHVPAALPSVLAVGAMDDRGEPIAFSNWGEAYQIQGILAPGENMLGAKAGGGSIRLSGTSFATPVVSGVAALLLSWQHQRGETPNPRAVRTALLKTAIPCGVDRSNADRRCLVGKLNIPGAIEYLKGGIMSEELETIAASGCGCGGNETIASAVSEADIEASAIAASTEAPAEMAASNADYAESFGSAIAEDANLGANAAATAQAPANPMAMASVATAQAPANPMAMAMPSSNVPSPPPYSPNFGMPNMTTAFVKPSQAPSELADKQVVYALGTLGYDFGTEARRDTFKQLMPAADMDGTMVPANPYDARQMVDYLGENLSEAKSLIWTLNLELTPIYAIEPTGAFGRDVYAVLQELLGGQIQPEDSEDYVERVSIPGILTGRSVKLFSGQVVPVLEPIGTRGLYGWKVNTLIGAALHTVRTETDAGDEDAMRGTLGSFLNRIYYDFRNLGITSQDRALNFATTNAFQAASTFAQAVAMGMELDSITVEKSPFCRIDSDCWDVKLKFFDPENNRRARKVFRFTIDVSDLVPVTLGEVRVWSSSY